MNANSRIVILVFEVVIPRFQSSVADGETLAQTIARRYDEPVEEDMTDSALGNLQCIRSADFKIVN